MSRFLRRKAEAWLILLAAKILCCRNVHRSPVVMRCDNNQMFEMARELEQIANRINKTSP